MTDHAITYKDQQDAFIARKRRQKREGKKYDLDHCQQCGGFYLVEVVQKSA